MLICVCSGYPRDWRSPTSQPRKADFDSGTILARSELIYLKFGLFKSVLACFDTAKVFKMALVTGSKTMSLLLPAVIVFLVSLSSASKKVTFHFTEFPYKETSKNEMAFHEYESACEQSPSCTQLRSVARTRCVRECISPSCYTEIYQADPLEEGEIDVRLNSFKGCFVQRVHRHRP